jgi:SAM-dependent methyltransferase
MKTELRPDRNALLDARPIVLAGSAQAPRDASRPLLLDHPNSGRPDFDRLASLYRWMEMASFGPFLQWCRCAWLDRLTLCRRGLVIGDGDGRFTARLLQANSTIVVDAVDASSAMLRALLRRAGGDSHRITTQIGDARTWQPGAARYDLVATHFFLDCLTTDEVRSLAQTVRGALVDEAQWAISEFAVPENLFGRIVARPLVAFLYRAFGWLTHLRVRCLPDHAAALQEAGFSLLQRRTWLGGLLVSELWSVGSVRTESEYEGLDR